VPGEVLTLHGAVVAQTGVDFRPRAWLDENTILGEDIPSLDSRQLAYVQLSDPGRVHDIGAQPGFAVVGALEP